MAQYRMQPNEVILLKRKEIRHGVWDTNSEIMLTNLNFIWTQNGMISKTPHVYPLNRIRVYKNRVDVRLGGSNQYDPALEIGFTDGTEETFGFISTSIASSRAEILNWVNEINKVITGNDADLQSEKNLPEIDTSVLGQFREVGKIYKEVLFGASKSINTSNSQQSQEATKQEKVAGTCKFCSAPITGNRGQIVHCQYCDSDQTL